MGFSVPLVSWLRGPLAQRMQESVLSQRMLDSGYFESDRLESMVAQHLGGQRNHADALWALTMFDGFLRLQDAS